LVSLIFDRELLGLAPWIDALQSRQRRHDFRALGIRLLLWKRSGASARFG